MDILDEGFQHRKELDKKEQLEAKLAHIDIKQAFPHIRNGRITLFILGVLFLIGIVISLVNSFHATWFILLEGSIFSILIFWSAVALPKNVKLYMSIGLGAYLVNILLYTLIDPVNLIRGILFKALIIYFLVRGLIAAFNYYDAKEKLERLGEIIPPKYKFV